jgi:hypothetical protein
LEQLVAGIRRENCHRELEWGSHVGNEVWWLLPDAGDLVWMAFYIMCLITSHARGYPFEVTGCAARRGKNDTPKQLTWLRRTPWWSPRHKFKIGQRLFLVRSIGSSVPGGAYVVIKRLPKRDSEFEYQIKSVNNEVDERVVRESELRTNPWRKTTL